MKLIVFAALLCVVAAERRYSAPRVVIRRVYEEPREVEQRYEAPREEVRETYEAPEEREEEPDVPRYGYSAPVEEKEVEEPIAILRHSAELRDDHSYDMQFEAENGIKVSESGRALPASGYEKEGSYEVAGEYSYYGADGKEYKVVYVADETGFQARGDHLPTPVPTEYPTPDPSNDGDDGSYKVEEVKEVFEEPDAPVRSYRAYN